MSTTKNRAIGIAFEPTRAALLAGIFGSSALLASGIASSQDAKASPENPAERLQEVVVTAQFRSQSLQEIPLSITAVTSDMLDQRSQTNIADVANHTPNVVLKPAGGGAAGSQTTSITIRGIGQNDFNLAMEPGVGIYIDDVYFGTAYGSLWKLLDLDRAEILRGPQGTLAGKNSEGGSVKLYSKAPNASDGGYVEAGAGNFDHYMLRAGANFSIVPDTVFMRVTALAEKEDGYVTRYDYQCRTGLSPTPNDPVPNPSQSTGGPNGCKLGTDGGTDVVALRGALRWIVNDNIEDQVTLDKTRDRSEALPTILIEQGTWLGPNWNTPNGGGAANVTANFAVPHGSYYNYSNYTGLAGTPYQYPYGNINALDAWGISNTLDVRFNDNLTLKSITAVRDLQNSTASDQDGSPLSRQGNVWKVRYRQYSQELRLNGSAGDHVQWTLGGFFFRYNAVQGGRVQLDGGAQSPGVVPIGFLLGPDSGGATFDFTFNDPVHVTSKSAFAHLEYTPWEKLTLTAGARYTDDYKKYDFTRDLAPGFPGSFFAGLVLPTDGASGTFSGSRTDWRVSATYKLAPAVNLYAQVATGFKGGGVNPRPFYVEQVQPFDPETVTAYEVGAKTFLFDRRLRLNLAAFFNDYQDVQVQLLSCPQFVPPGAPPNCGLPANVGKAHVKGAEAEAEFTPVAHASIDLSLSYLDYQWTSLDPATGLTTDNVAPFLPKYKASLGLQYTFASEQRGSVTPRIDYEYQSEQASNVENFPGTQIGGYGLLNARLTYNSPDDAWQVALAATNLLDKYYPVLNFYSLPPVGTANVSTLIPGRPREVVLTVKRKF